MDIPQVYVVEEPIKVKAKKGPDQWRIRLSNGVVCNLRAVAFMIGKTPNSIKNLAKRNGWTHPRLLTPENLNKDKIKKVTTRKRKS